MVLKLMSNRHETAKDLRNKYGLSVSNAKLLADKTSFGLREILGVRNEA